MFCDIVARTEPARIRYEDGEIIVIDNVLHRVPVMLLAIPKSHMTQGELWSNGTIANLGRVAIDMGDQFCPGGYRLLSNFGSDGMQTQEHGHVHILGGTHLGLYA